MSRQAFDLRRPAQRLAAGFLLMFLAAGAFGDTPLATLGDAEVTEADVRAALIDVDPEHRGGMLNDPERVGNLLQTILLRRAMVQDVRDRVDAEAREQAEAQAEQQALATLALEYIPRTTDQRAVEQLARELHAREAAAAKDRYLLDFDLVHVLVDSRDWDAAKALAQELRDEIHEDPSTVQAMRAGMHTGVKANRFEGVSPSELDAEVAGVLDQLRPGEISDPLIAPIGYRLVRLGDRRPVETLPFEAERQHWLQTAERALMAQGRAELRSLHDDRALAEMATEADIDESPVAQAYLRQAREEAVLQAYKQAYLAEEVPADVSALARERYIANKSEYHTEPLIDIAVVRVRGIDQANLAGFRDELETYVAQHGVTRVEQEVKSMAGVPTVQGSVRQAVPFKMMRGEILRIVDRLVREGRYVAVDESHGFTTFIAVDNYAPPRQRDYEEVVDEIKETIAKELNEAAWRRHVAPYHQLALEADPDRIAALRSLESSG